jgi:hypothetical protein
MSNSQNNPEPHETAENLPDMVVFGAEAKKMTDAEFEAMILAMPIGSTIEFPDGAPIEFSDKNTEGE